MTNFGALQRLDQVVSAESPQFLCGRIILIENQVLVAPISGKPCAYYEAVIEELQERNDENGVHGIQDADDPHKVWVLLYHEFKSADFALIDPAFPDKLVYIPGRETSISVLANEDTMTRKRLKSKLVVRDVDSQHVTKEFLARGNVSIDGSKRTIRFREANFEQGEQIGVLGVVTGPDPNVKVLKTVTKEALSEEFFSSKGLSDWDRRAWRDLAQQPCIIVTDMEKYLQGLVISELSSKQQLAKAFTEAETSQTMSR
eukprot:gene24137-29195_t